MAILFGHPGGNPNSHHAALAHFEAGRLEAFCVPWMPTPSELAVLRQVPGLSHWVARLERRSVRELLEVPRVEGRLGEWVRMCKRLLGAKTEPLAFAANDWLMRNMARECRRHTVSAVHAYEDCSLLAFEEARRLGKACIYELPIAHHREWQEIKARLQRDYAEWLPDTTESICGPLTTPEQKDRELELADVVLAPCGFVRRSIERFTDRPVAVVPYGVDLSFWGREEDDSCDRTEPCPLRFIYAGHGSVRKGVPLLLEAWERAEVQDAELELVGPWQLREAKRRELPKRVHWSGPVSQRELRRRYHHSHIFVFPSHFEGFGLVIAEAMASGLAVIASDATAAPELFDADCGRLVPSGDMDALVRELRWMGENRGRIKEMGRAAKKRAGEFDWRHYRTSLSEAVQPFCNE
jgi:starch synthase